MRRRVAVLTLAALAGCGGVDRLVAVGEADAGPACVSGSFALDRATPGRPCVFLTPSVPDARGSIAVRLDGAELPYDPSGARGWSWGARADGEVVLAGAACARAAAEAAPALSARVSCAAAVVP